MNRFTRQLENESQLAKELPQFRIRVPNSQNATECHRVSRFASGVAVRGSRGPVTPLSFSNRPTLEYC
jgi:hypothetical protein